MNIIFNDSNNDIGGIEVMFIEMASYLSKNNFVYFIVDQNSIYEKYLANHSNIQFIRKKITGNIEFLSSKELDIEKNNVLSQLNLENEYVVISPYYQKLQYAMAIFNSNFKHINLWAHPENWIRQSKMMPSKGFAKNIIKNPKFHYQRNLLRILDEKKAHYYSARSVVIFNNWYYSLSLNIPVVETLPIQTTTESPKEYKEISDVNTVKILWCGRFARFKLEAIIEISKVLNSLAEKCPEKKIEYGIIGFGSESETNYIKQNVKNENIEVQYYGKVKPNELFKIFKEYDVGIGMGLTVKKMAQIGLPAIIIDSVDKEVEHKKNSNWLFNTSEGDAGDGYYYRIANKSLESRQELSEILLEVIEKPDLLEEYSKKSLIFVEEYYSFEKQIQSIIDVAKNSTFYSNDYPIFRRNIILRFLYPFYRKIKEMKKIFSYK